MRHLDDWLHGYLAYTAEQESPEIFHVWAGISAIAGALRRRVLFRMGYFSFHPNMYIVLVSPPGMCRKSTCMAIARKRMEKVDGINFTVDSTSREALILALSQSLVDGHSSMTAFSSELASLITTSQMDMVAFLTDIFDNPDQWIHKTKGSGTQKITAPYLNLFAATTPDWIAKAMPLDTIGIGLTSRIVFVYSAEPREANPFPELSPSQVKLERLLEEDLAQIATMQGEFRFAPDAKAAYEVWYKARHRMKENLDPRLAGYFERKSVHLSKLCMVVSASRREDMLITMEDYTSAQQILAVTEEAMPQVFAHVGKNPLNMDYEQALAIMLRRPDGVTRAEMIDALKHNVRKEELDEVLDTLTTIGKIRLSGTGKYFAVTE